MKMDILIIHGDIWEINMWSVLVDYGDDEAKTIKMFDDEQDAVGYADDMACMGYYSTLFEYDKSHNEFVEWIS